MTEVPADTPVTIPDDEPIVARVVETLVQLPPATVLDSVDEAPILIAVVPDIVPALRGVTVVLTVLTPVATQPLLSVTDSVNVLVAGVAGTEATVAVLVRAGALTLEL